MVLIRDIFEVQILRGSQCFLFIQFEQTVRIISSFIFTIPLQTNIQPQYNQSRQQSYMSSKFGFKIHKDTQQYFEMLQSWQEYHSFVKDRIFQRLTELYTKKIACQNTYSESMQLLIGQAENKVKSILLYASQCKHSHPELHSYAHIFKCVEEELKQEVNQILKRQQKHQKQYIQLLTAAKESYLKDQRSLIQHAKKQLESSAYSIGSVIKDIDKKEQNIQDTKNQCFSQFIITINELDETMIKDKFLQKENQSNFTFFGRKRRQINDIIEIVLQIQAQIKQDTKQIKQIQQQRNIYMQKLGFKLAQNQSELLQILYKICSCFKKPFQPLKVPIDYNQIVYTNSVFLKESANNYFVQINKSAVYLLLNPHIGNKLIMNHRKSIVAMLAFTGREHRMALQYPYNQTQQEQNSNQQTVNQYQKCMQFLQRLKSNVANSFLQDQELKEQFTYFKACFKKKPYRETFLFYLFELAKVSSGIQSLVTRNYAVLVRVLHIFFTQCLTYYDCPSAIKAIMLSYHIDFDQLSLYTELRQHQLWKRSEFWEVSFVHSVYQYFEMIIINFHDVIDKYQQQPKQQKTNWFANIFRLKQRNQQKPLIKANPLKQFYYEIIKNLTVIYLANMVLLKVPIIVINKFKSNLSSTIEKLGWQQQSFQLYKTIIEIVGQKPQQQLKKLLSDHNIKNRIMSKLLGTTQQIRQASSLSQSISSWLSQK